ncbi:hypothetical protein BDY19DRAFT_993280 [Irpex rosettiformis]|uniref:Uncharacterized protein n=1 Tax=Irpex rosettiformis TaxID=378272 RepID=A0ACB8U3V1_9APHY|nr:hypothetical protein BDY19DRAFT_993280 [Irpex rosettiformis]
MEWVGAICSDPGPTRRRESLKDVKEGDSVFDQQIAAEDSNECGVQVRAACQTEACLCLKRLLGAPPLLLNADFLFSLHTCLLCGYPSHAYLIPMTSDKGERPPIVTERPPGSLQLDSDDDGSLGSSPTLDYIDLANFSDGEVDTATANPNDAEVGTVTANLSDAEAGTTTANEGSVLSPTAVYEMALATLGDDGVAREQVFSSDDPDEGIVNVMGSSSRNLPSVTSGPAASTSRIITDLIDRIPGMYRILDLVSEQGSGGLVDKIIISQDSFGSFVNDLCPRAYQSMTHVNFDALDRLDIRPVGLYGSKSEIVRYLADLQLVDDDTARLLLESKDEVTHATQKTLRSGLYLIRSNASNLVYALYWPQDTTWNDDAITSVARNRETFMRYLTKIADQIVVLISDEHADGIVWDEGPSGNPKKSSKSGRLFTYKVAKTHEQEENVTVHPGFEIHNHSFKPSSPPEDGSVDPQVLLPRLVLGDTNIGVLTPVYEPAREIVKEINETYSTFRIKELLKSQSFQLDESLSEESLELLEKNDLSKVAGEDFEALQKARTTATQELDLADKEHLAALQTEISKQHDLIIEALREKIFGALGGRFGPTLVERLRAEPAFASVDIDNASDLLAHIAALHPRLEKSLRELHEDYNLTSVPSRRFTKRKTIILAAEKELIEKSQLSPNEQSKLVEDLVNYKPDNLDKPESQGYLKKLLSYFSNSDPSKNSVDNDRQFLRRLPDICARFPVLVNLADETWARAVEHLSLHINRIVNRAAQEVEDTQVQECKKQLAAQRKLAWTNVLDDSRGAFLTAVKERFVRDPERSMLVQRVETAYSRWRPYNNYNQPSQFVIIGRLNRLTHACLKYHISVTQLTEGDKHKLQLDSTFVPKPKLSSTTYTFTLPVDQHVIMCQLLERDKCLLITSNSQGDLRIFLDRLVNIDQAVAQPNGWKKQLVAEKIGGESVVAFDESRRMLAICTIEKPTLHFFIFDELFSTLQGYGAPVDLRSWYEMRTSIKHITFRSGVTDELLLVDESLQARIFSMATRLFRPAFVQLTAMPLGMVSSPDGSCVFAVECHPGGAIFLQAYHWGSFGSTSGISLQLPDMPLGSWAITSLAKRSASQCYFVALGSSGLVLNSVLLSITHKSTEFSFAADRKKKDTPSRPASSTHTSLIGCHKDVWTRFPVVPAVRRHTFKTSSRSPRSLTFVSHLAVEHFRRTFNAMITKFETSTRKPTGDELSSIRIHATTYPELYTRATDHISCFKAGEWLVDILCLIPIHLAVARDNRFIPLKDGVWSLELERALLGATVEQVIDALSFGWYESIFQSYMSTKPVKVVSSMGEQSVGKSFTMNHLVDTSFAGSAMRTTEGVWMAVTPTDDMLIVALDFEGVHSIERTAQEDSLLVLFNTAISNLVLFRNNFALSRDITGLFQSFQSSSTVLDPAVNPSLFQSTLVIIIKDVVESDKDDITTEFSLKFQDIVQTEQEANFISRLHRGSLTIIPWPVIGSQEFYTMFSEVEALLDDQDVSHPQASTFLHKMKTLMAKLKINDWGSIDENLASHRAQHLLGLLSRVLAIGSMELDPVPEPLTDLDTNRALDSTDSNAQFFIIQPDGVTNDNARKVHLATLRASWPDDNKRFSAPDASDAAWAEELDQYLATLAESRVEHVRTWLDVNTSRFAAHPTSFTALRHEFDNLSVALKAHVKLCKMQCASCQLVCIQPRHHDGGHDCETSHQCPQACSFADDHSTQPMFCGMPAGHPGKHICDISVHLCGQPCRLSGKGGCLDRCAKIVNHADEEHLCQARAHECSMVGNKAYFLLSITLVSNHEPQPCSLNIVRLQDGSTYSCPELCCISSEEEHFEHRCKQRSCPIKCQLCKRFCANEDHLHGLLDHALHLCGAEHSCRALCQSEGICKIETTPESIVATFAGRHETFQYTKYSQASKKLQCAIPIPPGLMQHSGRHLHELGGNVFHYCQERNCGYFCTLPLGHTQAEHETSHGSMSRTLWTIEGPDGTALEVNGRKFASNDTGAPMLCSMLCKSLGRHAHIDYCLSQDAATCSGADLKHINERMLPDPDAPKDWISHDLYWRRTGFKDPYPQEDKTEFSKCDAMCTGQEHQADANGRPQPSYCNLSIFHPPHVVHAPPPNGTGYISGDGHHFLCRNPAVLQRAFHVMFVVDRSGSMSHGDKRPLDGTPITATLRQRHNNRVGAVYSSLYSFWQARHAAITAGAARRDSYSVILFDHELHRAVTNDFASTPDALINSLLQYGARGGTNFDLALQEAKRCMENHWSTERAPVVIFLSDGECGVTDAIVHSLCQTAITRGMPLSFHSVAFGPSNQNLRRMAQISTDVQNGVRPDPMNPIVPSSYSEAIDSIRLAETFLGIAASLTKPRGALMRTT